MRRRGTLLAAATVAAHGLNLLFNVVMARMLGASSFADLATIIAIWLASALVASSLQLSAARSSASAIERLGPGAVPGLRATLLARARRRSALLALGWIAGAPLLDIVFHSHSVVPYMVVGLGMPAFLAQSVERGILQGQARFTAVGAALVTEAAVRLVAGVALVAAGLGLDGAALSLTVSFLAGWALPHRLLGRVDRRASAAPEVHADLRVGRGPVTLLTLAEVMASYGDLIVVRHTFAASTVGIYAALSLAGRGVFFAAQPVNLIAFPIVARQAAARISLRRSRALALAAVAVLGGLALTVLAGGGTPLVTLVFGARYARAADYVAAYGGASLLLAIGFVLASVDAAAGRLGGPLLAVTAAVAQFVALCVWHGSLHQVVWVQVVVMGAFALSAAALTFGVDRGRDRGSVRARRAAAPVVLTAPPEGGLNTV